MLLPATVWVGLVAGSASGGMQRVADQASMAAGSPAVGVVDLGRVVQTSSPDSLGVGSSTYGANPLSSPAQSAAERRLDARAVRLPVGYRNGRVTSSAAGGPTDLDLPALVRQYRSWGFAVLAVVGGRTNDTDVQPGDATKIMQELGFDGVEYSSPNEPNNRGESVQDAIGHAMMISDEGRALKPDFTIWGPVWSWYDRASLRSFAAAMGDRLAGIDYHHYAMGSESLPTAAALAQTAQWEQEVRDTRADLVALGREPKVNVDELNFSWRYDDGTPGGNDRFFTAVNTVWMTSVLGHILVAGGGALPYATQNGPLGVMVEGETNPDGRPESSPMPAFWGIGNWTGAQAWPHFRGNFYATSSDDPDVEVFAVDNEAGGKNLVLINKSEARQPDLSLTIRGASSGSYRAFRTDPAAPYDAPALIAQDGYDAAAKMFSLPPLTVTVLVLAPGGTTTHKASVPRALTAGRSTDGAAVVLGWQQPAANGGSPVMGYLISRDGRDTTGGGTYNTTLAATARGFTFTLLDKASAYTFTVRAVTSRGPGRTARVWVAASPS